MGGHRVFFVAFAHLNAAVHDIVKNYLPHHDGDRLLRCQVDVLSFPRFLPVNEGREDGEGGCRSTAQINGTHEIARLTVLVAGQEGYPSQGGKRRGIADILPFRTYLTACRRGKVNNIRFVFAYRIITKAESFDDTRPHVLDNYITDGDQFLGDVHRFGFGDIQGHALLVKIEAVENRRLIGTRELHSCREGKRSGMIQTAPALNLDDLSTQQAEEARRIRPRPGRGKFSDSYSL